ncbi:hypothetical protein [Adhaeribacter aquaticus]|uniref:hypothetical protein n=1 Tax=Adhaeribacter aquaticus TaxID=299567 RepID=UPI00047BB57A|nr:hypothetical protein [Adhaeribacter aquaticus]
MPGKLIFDYKKNKGLVYFSIALFGLVLLIMLVRAFVLEPWLQKKLEKTVQEKSQGLYSFKVAQLQTSLLSGTLTLKGITLTPNPNLWQNRKKQNYPNLPPLLVQLKAEAIDFRGLSYLNLLFNKPLELTQISLNKPIIHAMQMAKDTTSQPLHQKLSGPLKNFKLGAFKIREATFSYKKFQDKWHTVELDSFSLTVNDIRFDSIAYNDPERQYYAKHIEAYANQSNILLPDAYYRLKTKKVWLNTADKKIELRQVRVVPLYTPAALAKRVGNAVPQLRIWIPLVKFSGADFPNFARLSSLNINSFQVYNPRVQAFMDTKNFKQKQKKPLLHDMVQQVKVNFNLKQCNIHNLFIRYDELAPRATRTGYLTLEKINVSITNFTNDKKYMSAKNPAVLRGEVVVMGEAHVKAVTRVNLLDPQAQHIISGSIGKANPKIINPIIEPAYYVRVKSGTLQKGDFRMTLTRTAVTGTMHLYYDDFKVDLLSKDKSGNEEASKERGKEKKQTVFKKVLTVFANKIVLNSNNNTLEGKFKEGKINSNRRMNRSFFTFWIDGLTSGVRSTLGLNSQVPQSN